MLKPIDFTTNYFALLDESQKITGVKPAPLLFNYTHTTEEDAFTDEQWSNLVKVASIIKANVNRFDMQTWHKKSECGTTHCIAGWAESLAKNDTNYCEDYSAMETENIAKDMLSNHVSFFLRLQI